MSDPPSLPSATLVPEGPLLPFWNCHAAEQGLNVQMEGDGAESNLGVPQDIQLLPAPPGTSHL